MNQKLSIRYIFLVIILLHFEVNIFSKNNINHPSNTLNIPLPPSKGELLERYSPFEGGRGMSMVYKSSKILTGEEIYKANCSFCHNGAVKEAPKFESLQLLSSNAIIKTLTSGVMKVQGASLSPKDRKLVAEFISKIASQQPQIVAGNCDFSDKKTAKNQVVKVGNWGMNLSNQRFVNDARINAKNVGNLTLKWAFAFPEATRARSQPTVAGNTLFTASQHGIIYALDTKTGCIRWTFQAEDEIRSAISIGTDKNGNANRLYFGDFKANVYALDMQTRKLLWKKKIDSHEVATITGSLVLHQNRLYIPVSSTEVISAYNPKYQCCTFRGSVVALDAEDGSQIWKNYTTEEPKPQGINAKGTQNFGPSGAPVWSSPTIDIKRGLLYVGTGENYTQPTSENSDAIIAMNLSDGQIKWVRQTVGKDAWNAACTMPNGANCPENFGPDFDFGAPPILVSGQQDLVLAGQKSGMIYALNPDKNGEIVWQARAGRGGIMGGIHWGMASNNQTLYVPVNDREAYQADKDKPSFPGLHALDVANGKLQWSMIEKNRCPEDVKWACGSGLSAAITATPELVFGGALDGILHAYSTIDGKVLWEFDANKEFTSVNGVKGSGGAFDSSGPVIVGNQLFVNSGYAKFNEKAGNVLLCFETLPKSSVKSINHVSLSVNDLDKSVQFYKKVTGLKEISKSEIRKPILAEQMSGFQHHNRKSMVMKGNNGQLELIHFEGNKQPSVMPVQGSGITHVCYQSPATNSIYEKAKANGATVVSRGNSPVNRGFGIQYAYIRDANNIMFEIEQFDKPTFTEDNWIGHVAIVTHDIDRLVEFYTQLFGNKPINRVDNVKNNPKLDDIANIDSLKLRGAWFNVGNMLLEIWQFDNPKTIANPKPIPFTQTGYQKIAFEVGDLQEDYTRLLENGVNFLSKPVEKEVYLRDPDGNLLMLIEKKD